MRVLDLFCGAGGAAAGYVFAGHEVVGVDLHPQPNYPLEFIQADALEYLHDNAHAVRNTFAMVHASPPCQAHSIASARWRNEGRVYVDLVADTRDALVGLGIPYVIENVPGAPLIDPIRLCGEMFGLRVVRHRLFEASFHIDEPVHLKHRPTITVRGNKRSWYACVAGHGGEGYSSKLADWQDAMGIHWMTKKELTQAIPPAYTKYIGQQL